MISIIIPSRNEQFLSHTIKDLLKNAEGEIEIIAVLDGYWPPKDEIIENNKVIYLHKGKAEGMRQGINDGVAISSGEYLMKIDAHCMVDKGFDIKLEANCEDNWIVIPRRKRLDAEKWEIEDVGKPDVDYNYLSFPDNPADFGGPGLNGRIWEQKALARTDPKYDIDEDLSFQGSCWFMTKKHFNNMEFMDYKNWGPFWNEAQELGLRTFLSGGKVMRNKKTWYAHLHKGKKYGRGYFLDNRWSKMGTTRAMRYFAGEHVWHKQKHPLSWLLKKFMPLPQWTDKNISELVKREGSFWK